MPSAGATPPLRRSPLERVLSLISDVRPGEGRGAAALLASVFLLLAASYLLKPARDGLLAAAEVPSLSSMELKAYSSLAQGLLLTALLPLYVRLTTRLARRELVTRVTLALVASLLLFWSLQPGLLLPTTAIVGAAFYVWVGALNVFVLAQFWTFAADLVSDARGRRLFPVIALGGTAGAVLGARTAGSLVAPEGVTTYTLILLAAALLLAALALMRAIDDAGWDTPGHREPPAPARGATTLRLLRRHRYLLAIAGIVVAAEWVKSNTDNLLFAIVQEVVRDEATHRGLAGEGLDGFVADRTTAFYGDLFFWINLSALLAQAGLASRSLRYAGVGATLMLLPLVATVGYGALALVPALGLFRVTKIAEVALGYSLQNTALQTLWLRTTREAKYKVKPFVDTIGVRLGDGLAAVSAFVGIQVLALAVPAFFVLNAVLAAAWLVLAVVAARTYGRLPAEASGHTSGRWQPRPAGHQRDDQEDQRDDHQ